MSDSKACLKHTRTTCLRKRNGEHGLRMNDQSSWRRTTLEDSIRQTESYKEQVQITREQQALHPSNHAGPSRASAQPTPGSGSEEIHIRSHVQSDDASSTASESSDRCQKQTAKAGQLNSDERVIRPERRRRKVTDDTSSDDDNLDGKPGVASGAQPSQAPSRSLGCSSSRAKSVETTQERPHATKPRADTRSRTSDLEFFAVNTATPRTG